MSRLVKAYHRHLLQQCRSQKSQSQIGGCCRHGSRLYTSVPSPAPAADSVLDRCLSLKPGDILKGYKIERVVNVQELNLVSVLLSHNKTAAKHLHIARDDRNNAFGVSFRTTPMDSTGVPHILEHVALCGSEKFPVRDPFFKMLNRSLSTFMNAMTSNDWTIYPFSSQNRKDFRNLMSVYMDAAFYPMLREIDFRQEGWRLEHEDLNDPSTPIIYKGVVFNEMKGVYSSQHSIFHDAAQNNLLPDHTYGICYGGLPICIPDLTWQALKEFHSSHYHPSNSRFFTYGDQPLEDHLELIEKSVLSRFGKLVTDTSVPLQPRWSKPRRTKITCRLNDMLPDADKQTTVAVSYLLTDICDAYESNVLSLIGNLLVNGENSPFYQLLIASNIGSGYAPVCGFEHNTRNTSFSIGLEGIREEDVGRVLTIIDETFERVVREGFPQERVDALLSQIELFTKHQTSNFGMSLMLSLTTMWNHDADPTVGLQINKIVTRFKQEMAEDPNYLINYVKQYFVNNKHRSTVEMSPETGYEEKQQEQEAVKLKSMVDALTPQDRENIYAQGKRLAETQMADEDLSCLPTILISDIDKELVRTSVDDILLDGVNVQLCAQPTNEVVYFHALSDISDLRSHLKPYVPLFCSIANKMGAGDLDYKAQSQQMDRYTGGLSISHSISSSPSDLTNVQQTIHMSSFCLKDNLTPMFGLWTDIFNSVRLEDLERVSMLLRMNAADSVNSISHSGHQYAMCHSASSLSEANQLREVLSGITQVSFLKSLSENDDQQPILGYLRDIAQHVLNKSSIKCSLNAESDTMNVATDELQRFFKSLPGEVEGPPSYVQLEHTERTSALSKTHFAMDFSVNYSGLSIPTVPYLHEDFAPVRVMARLLTNKYLHREIREKGGAYGGGATGDSSGHMSFYSYRDPNSLKTIETMLSSADWLASGQFTQQDVDEAIIAIFQKVDSPVAPGSRGVGLLISGVTDDMKQNHRDQLRAVTAAQIKTVAEKYLKSPKNQGISLIGPNNETISADSEWTISGRENCCQLPTLQ